MEIKVLGPGCKKCKALEQEVAAVVAEMKLDARVEKITDVNKIIDYGVFMTPGLVINGKVKVVGKVPDRAEIKRLIEEERDVGLL
ncbi:thioredoxin family protein [Desulforudis sp. 1088]|uniref:thioredoxin family protein n=1 Tax=unclassified Candidatus Desulforudis TaxID=2635950 RepID=UPI00346FFDDD